MFCQIQLKALNCIYTSVTYTYHFHHVQDAEDLSFRKGDILVVLEQNEEKWWTAMDEQGNKGLIPEPYVKKVCIAVTCSDAVLCGRNLN